MSMEKYSKEMISVAYTLYTLLNPSDRVIVGIDSFAEAVKANMATLDTPQSDALQSAVSMPTDNRITEQKAELTLEKGFASAEETINNKEKLASMLEKLKQKMKSLPMTGSVLANVPTMFKLLNSFFKDEYTSIPKKDLIIVVSALSYLISPIDLVPDFIPVIGFLDDMAIVSVCVKSTKPELEKYLEWRKMNKMDDTSGRPDE